MELRRGINKARSLRSRQTDTESLLWMRLRARRLSGFKFRRQVPINGYVVDFVCTEAWLVVEVDGGQHGDRIEFDAKRSAALAKSGFRVLRFWNNEVLQRLDDVLGEIPTAASGATLTLALSRQRERGLRALSGVNLRQYGGSSPAARCYFTQR